MQRAKNMRKGHAAILVVSCAGVFVRSAAAQSNDLPNANLPGNSPTLPNSNLPGSMPTSNPITLPNTDTSRATVPWEPGLYPDGSNVPVRNPTAPAPPAERAEPDQAQIWRALVDAQVEAQRAQRDAAQARQEAAAAKEQADQATRDSAALRDELARERDEQAKRSEATR